MSIFSAIPVPVAGIPPTPSRSSSLPPSPSKSAIVIDNGSSQLRAGWSHESTPRIVDDQLVSRYKDRKNNRTVLLYGAGAEVDATTRAHSRPVWEGDLLLNGDNLEYALDYAFLNLNITSESVEHPVVMSERLASPMHSRAITSELLFEAYGVPSVTYGVDSLFSFSRQGISDGVVLGMGANSTSIIPVVGGKGIMTSARRLGWGGKQAEELLLKLVQMKYPGFPTRVTPQQATFMYRDSCYFADNYSSVVRSFSDPEQIAAVDRVHQFPFVAPVIDEKSEEELARAAEKRKENGRRLVEMQQKQRVEKLMKQEADLAAFLEIREAKSTEKKAAFQARLENAGFEDEADLNSSIRKIEESMKRARKKDLGENAEPEEEPSFPLVDREDSELTEEEVKEKRKQKLAKAGYDARMRLKAEKLAEKARLDELEKRDEEERISDPMGWSAKLRVEHEAVIARIGERKKRRAALGDRKSAAAQHRMKSIANLAAEGPASKRRRKGGDDDGFGRTDDDWGIYREITTGNDSEEEEEDLAQISTIESKLLEHDPAFSTASTFVSRSQQQDSLLTAFLRGTKPKFDPESLEQSYQLHLNVERTRVPETWFQPSMAGLDSAGITEIISHVLQEIDTTTRAKAQQAIFVTGGSSLLPGIVSRLRTSLQPLLPYQSSFNVLHPKEDPRLDAWLGMAEWARSDAFAKGTGRVTKADYEEHGGEFVREWEWGNWRTG